jgi:poly-gamma-glutamate synthesis protein (capsule biosynthesis protein)
VLLDVRGVKVALLSYTFGFNGIPHPGGDTWRANRLDESHIRAAARKARAAGAQIVVLVCHWGTEYDHQPNTQQRTLALRFAADPDIDLVVGHHAHVVQPLEKIGDTWVAYGLGNFVAAHRQPTAANTEGLLVRFTFRRAADGSWHVSNAEYAALLITDTLPMRVLDVRHELGTRGSGQASPDRLRQAERRTEAVVDSRGAAEDGATPITSP